MQKMVELADRQLAALSQQRDDLETAMAELRELREETLANLTSS